MKIHYATLLIIESYMQYHRMIIRYLSLAILLFLPTVSHSIACLGPNDTTYFIAKQGATLSNQTSSFKQEFSINKKCTITLRVVNETIASAGVFDLVEVDKFVNNNGAQAYISFYREFGTQSATLSAGTYAVAIRNETNGPNRYSFELDFEKAFDNAVLVNSKTEALSVAANGGKAWQPFTTTSTTRLWIDGVSIDLDFYVFPASELTNFKNGNSFQYFTEFGSISSPNQPGGFEMKLLPGDYYMGFINNNAKIKTVTYTLERHQVQNSSSNTGSGSGGNGGGSAPPIDNETSGGGGALSFSFLSFIGLLLTLLRFNRALPFVMAFFIASCGGGSSGDNSSDVIVDGGAVSNQITSATTFDEYLSQLQTYNNRGLNTISDSDVSSFFSYNGRLNDYQGDTLANGLSNPMDGIYHNFAQPGQGFANTWPSSPNGEFTLVPVNSSFSNITNARDLTNGQTIEGDFKLFFGAKGTQFFGTTNQRVPILILMEGIIKLNGVPQYRALNKFEGYLYESTIDNGPSYNGVPGSLFSGTYSQYAIEAFNEGTTGLLGSYEDYFIRQSGGPVGITPANPNFQYTDSSEPNNSFASANILYLSSSTRTKTSATVSVNDSDSTDIYRYDPELLKILYPELNWSYYTNVNVQYRFGGTAYLFQTSSPSTTLSFEVYNGFGVLLKGIKKVTTKAANVNPVYTYSYTGSIPYNSTKDNIGNLYLGDLSVGQGPFYMVYSSSGYNNNQNFSLIVDF